MQILTHSNRVFPQHESGYIKACSFRFIFFSDDDDDDLLVLLNLLSNTDTTHTSTTHLLLLTTPTYHFKNLTKTHIYKNYPTRKSNSKKEIKFSHFFDIIVLHKFSTKIIKTYVIFVFSSNFSNGCAKRYQITRSPSLVGEGHVLVKKSSLLLHKSSIFFSFRNYFSSACHKHHSVRLQLNKKINAKLFLKN